MSTAKANMTVIELKNVLQKRLPTWTVTQGTDSSNNPTLLLSADATPAATEQVVFLRVRPVTTLATDVLGIAQKVFTPHVIEVVLELGAAGSGAALPLLSTANLVPILGELFKRGMKIDLWLSATTVVPAVGEISGAPDVSWSPSQVNPLAGQ